MNLSKIRDEKQSNYQLAALVFPDNFYVTLAAKLEEIFTNKGKKGSKFGITLTPTVLDNSIRCSTDSFGNGSIVVNGKRVNASGKGMKFVEAAVTELFAMESRQDITIKRPKGRTYKSDRMEMKEIKGTIFPKLYKTAAFASGSQDLALQGSYKTKYAFTAEQVKNVKDFDDSNYNLVDNGFLRYYVRKDIQHKDLTDSNTNLREVINAFINQDKALDALARNKDFDFINKDYPRNPYWIVAFEDTLFKATWHESVWDINFINNPEHIKIK